MVHDTIAIGVKTVLRFQALEVVRTLKESIPIERVKMKIRISMGMADSKKCKDQIKALFLTIISEDHDGQFELVS